MNEQHVNAEHSKQENWYGIIYYAPKDPNVVVPKRSGSQYGYTVNFARRGSYLILSIPFLIGAAIVAGVALFGQ